MFTATVHDKFRATFYLIFDFCEHDLAGLLSNMNVKFSLGEIKRVMQQLLNGLYYIHSNKVNLITLSIIYIYLFISLWLTMIVFSVVLFF